MQCKHKEVLIVFIALTLCFIWCNSALPATASGAFSGWIKDMINSLIGSTGSRITVSGDGVLRKLAHAIEFAVLGVELTVLWHHDLKKHLPLLLLCGLTTALIDETIQLFAAGRGSSVKDIWIDMTGFVFGFSLVLLIEYLIKKKTEKLVH